MYGANVGSVLYRQKQLPIFQNRMYSTAKEARSCLKGDVSIVEDQKTGLVFNSSFDSDVMSYDDHYQNEQAVSSSFRGHLDIVASIVERTIGKESLIEIGCGKAFFLEMLIARGFDATGFDPTYEGSNPRVSRRYFESGMGISASGLILRHVLEHVQNPYSFLQTLRKANSGQGKVYIEVPCLDWILKNRAWYDIFYEHVNYFRLSDLKSMFGNVVEYGHLFGDQYIYIVADLSTLREPAMGYRRPLRFPHNFMDEAYSIPKAETNYSVVWGGASKGVIFSLLKERVGQPVDAVIDINPAKQGKYLPATGLLVEPPGEVLNRLPPGSTIYVMNSNYMEEIRNMSEDAYEYIGVDHG
jgi:hypothetical protein